MSGIRCAAKMKGEDRSPIKEGMNYRVSAYCEPCIAETQRIEEAIKIAEEACVLFYEVRITEYASGMICFVDAV